MRLLIPYLLMALLPALTLSSGDDCTLLHLQHCLMSLQNVTQSNDLLFGTTRSELLAVCSKLKDSVGCVDEHMRHCFNPYQTKVFNQVVAGGRQFLLELCVEGPIQEAYLRHSPCYKNVSLSEEKCAPKYRHLTHLSENVDGKTDVDEELKHSCCAFNAFVQCKEQFVRTDCGLDAADFLQQHLDRISRPLLQEHCAHYTYPSDSCDSGGKGREQSLLALLLATAAFVVVWKRNSVV